MQQNSLSTHVFPFVMALCVPLDAPGLSRVTADDSGSPPRREELGASTNPGPTLLLQSNIDKLVPILTIYRKCSMLFQYSPTKLLKMWNTCCIQTASMIVWRSQRHTGVSWFQSQGWRKKWPRPKRAAITRFCEATAEAGAQDGVRGWVIQNP